MGTPNADQQHTRYRQLNTTAQGGTNTTGTRWYGNTARHTDGYDQPAHRQVLINSNEAVRSTGNTGTPNGSTPVQTPTGTTQQGGTEQQTRYGTDQLATYTTTDQQQLRRFR